MPAQQVIRLSTRSVPRASRFEFYMDFLQRSLWQVSDWDSLPEDFHVESRGATLGCLTAITQSISAHHSHRTLGDVDRSAERSYHLFVGTSEPWSFTHRSRCEKLEAGDVVLIGEGEHETLAPRGFEGVIVKCPEHWIQTWVPDPLAISGRAIRGDSTWGRVLSPTLRQLSPEFALAPPLPAPVVVDQLGAVLALVAGEDEQRVEQQLSKRARDCIRQRCGEGGLTSEQVASTLGVPVQVLHRAFAAAKTTFAAELVGARVDAALAILRGPPLPLAEVARRTGFRQAGDLSRALRRLAGSRA